MLSSFYRYHLGEFEKLTFVRVFQAERDPDEEGDFMAFEQLMAESMKKQEKKKEKEKESKDKDKDKESSSKRHFGHNHSSPATSTPS